MVNIKLTMDGHGCPQLIIVENDRLWLTIVNYGCSCFIMVDHDWP